VAYDEGLAQRIRELLEERTDVEERRMFGGLAFLIGRHMCCGVVGDELMVRVGAEAYERALGLAHVREMDFTGRPLRGLVYVACEGFESDEDLARWLELGVSYVSGLPVEPRRGPKVRPKRS